ncbi:serine/threonine-protein kinase [Saccharothrix sp.]|uniref:serine/threonine-protein kinase n=1 Tax=Saccharothrix sp. TaxID=1873460 RepID=UPI002811AE69|nr:serine/threonine-protein kinase [Saccharothrix sp.]
MGEVVEERTVAGRYRLTDRIGAGGMGVVWRAEDTRLRRIVALKELVTRNGFDSDSVRRAVREGRIAARLQHANVIALYDVVEDDNRPWLVMEYLPSRSLAAILAERGTMPPDEVRRVGAQLAAGLAAAHASGVVHRDVKPGNVLVTEFGTVKVTDFGTSRVAGEGTITATGMLVGTPAYLAPEVARGEEIGFPADVFGVGATLYAALEGAPPFGTDGNPILLLHKAAEGKYPPPQNAGSLEPVLTRLLDPNPETRPTMAEAVRMLSEETVDPATVLAAALPQAPATRVIVPPTVPADTEPASGAEEAAAEPAPEAPAPTGDNPPTPPPATPPAAQSPAAAPTPDAANPPTPPAARPAAYGPPTPPAAQPASYGPPTPPAAQPAAAYSPAAPAADTPPVTRPIEDEAEQRDRKRAIVLLAAGLAVLLAVVVGVVLLNRDKTPTDPAAGPTDQSTSTTTEPSPEPQQPPVTSDDQPTTTTTQATTAPPQPAGGADKGLTDYYALLPADTQAGWSRLTENFRTTFNGGQTFAEYQDFWGKIAAVQLSNISPQGENRVAATITYTTKAGATETYNHVYTLVPVRGVWMIDGQA